MKIGILYICTGKYNIFWKSFYESSEKYLLRNHEIKYFVFTDAKNIDYQNNENIVRIYQKNLGWPQNTLRRFHIFNKHKKILGCMDFLFFCNANLLFVNEVNEEILPYEEELVVFKHPGYWNKQRSRFPYETNPESLAYIPSDKGNTYVMGGLNGGKTEDFLKMSQILSTNIDKDLKKGIIAVWHDESHLNNYIVDKKVKILDPSYGYVEDWNLPFHPKIVIRDKNQYGGHEFLRRKDENFFKKKLYSFIQRNILFKYR